MAVVKILEDKFNPEHPAREVVFNDSNVTVLKGKLSFYIGAEGREEILEEGATVFYDPNEDHGFKALEDSVAQAVVAPNPTKRSF